MAETETGRRSLHDELQYKCIQEAWRNKLHVHHCGMMQSQPGFPDLVIVGPKGVLWREVKVPPDTLKPAQVRLKYDLEASGQDFAVWEPRDWTSGKIRREMEAVR